MKMKVIVISVYTPTSTVVVVNNFQLILSLPQEWLIADYCLKVDEPVVTEAPPSGLTWKGHTSSVVSIDLAEAKELIITASTDHCVCLWSNKGRYIGMQLVVDPQLESQSLNKWQNNNSAWLY